MLAQDAVDEGLDIVGALSSGITDFFSQLFGFIPRLFGFLIILFVGWFVARLIAKVIGRVFEAIRLDHYLDRAGLGGPLERAGYRDSGKFVAKIIYYLIMLIVLKLAFGALAIDALNEPFDQLIAWIPKALVALVLIVIGGIVANIVRDLVSGFTAGQSYSSAVTSVAGIAVWLIFGLAALDQAQIAGDLIDTLTTAIFASLTFILVIKFGVGGIWAARDRFWPNVYDSVSSNSGSAQAAAPAPRPRQG